MMVRIGPELSRHRAARPGISAVAGACLAAGLAAVAGCDAGGPPATPVATAAAPAAQGSNLAQVIQRQGQGEKVRFQVVRFGTQTGFYEFAYLYNDHIEMTLNPKHPDYASVQGRTGGVVGPQFPLLPRDDRCLESVVITNDRGKSYRDPRAASSEARESMFVHALVLCAEGQELRGEFLVYRELNRAYVEGNPASQPCEEARFGGCSGQESKADVVLARDDAA